MDDAQLIRLLDSLRALPTEEEWFDFKVNNINPDEIGEYISALANSARLLGKENGCLVWGVDDRSHDVVGTRFQPRQERVGNQELEMWLNNLLHPSLSIRFYEFTAQVKSIVLLSIPICSYMPVRWKNVGYVRVGSSKTLLSNYPDRERALWMVDQPFEFDIALRSVPPERVLSLLNFTYYYDLTKQSLPSGTEGVLERLESERMLATVGDGTYNITNFGAILFAKKLSDFPGLKRKAVRVITYAGQDKTAGGRETIFDEGYALCFESMVRYINSQLPINEHIEQAFRVEAPTYPNIAIRELVPNVMVHQDLSATGTSPLIEIFSDRMDVTNPGRPLIQPLRFVDEPPRSRNQELAGFMRRVNICEERGSGIDKVIRAVELYQLPAPDIAQTDSSTRVTLFAKREFKDLTSQERIRACYWHSCLLHESGTQMTNESLRKRFALEEGKHNQVGRIISDARKAELIKPYDPDNKSPRYARYIPFWA